MKKPISEYPVMKACCKTCPFRILENGRQFDSVLASEVTKRTLFKGQQVCHGTEGANREWNNICKGSFDYNIEIYKRLGLDNLIKK